MKPSACLGLLLVAALPLFGCASGQVMSPADKARESAVLNGYLDRWAQAYLHRDINSVADTFAPDEDSILIGTDENERLVGKKAMLAGLQKGFGSVDGFTKVNFSDRHVFFSRDGNTAWVISTGEMEFTAGGKPGAIKGIRVTSVFERRDGTWLMVHNHASLGVAPQPGNAGG